MPNKETENLWEYWEKEVEKFKNALNCPPPDTTIRHWQRYLLFIFMQELSKNVLNENESFDSIIDKIMEALQVGCGFNRARFYQVIGNDENEDINVLKLKKISKGHGSVKIGLTLKTKYGKDDAVNTFLTKTPLIVDDAERLSLIYKEKLGTKGPYTAIPLFVEEKPYGMICADTISPDISSEITHQVNYLEYKEHFDTFARTIMVAIENRHMFEQREQKIMQFEMVKKFNELIESETEKEKLLNSFMKHCVTLFGADGADLKLYNREIKKLEAFADYGVDVAPPDILESKPKNISFSSQALKNKKPLLINDLPSYPLMKRNIGYYKKKDHKKYLKYLEILNNRKSAIIVPLIKHTGEIYGVLDLYSRNLSQFTERDKENLMALGNSVTYAVDKTMQLERRDKLLNMRGKLHTMLQRSVEEAHDLQSVLEIIRNCCFKLEIIKDIKKACLFTEDPLTGELKPPFVKCAEGQNCRLCLEKNPIIQKAFDIVQGQDGRNDRALPICMKGKSIGVLYLQGKHKIQLDRDEEELLNIITNTAAILITTARNYETKIKQGATLYETIQSISEIRDFRYWFSPVMEEMMKIIGRNNRNFHLVMAEKVKGKLKLIVRETGGLYIEGEKPILYRENIINAEIPKDNSLSGLVVDKKKSYIIHDVERNQKLEEGDTEKLPIYIHPEVDVKAEVGIPLKIKEGTKEEKVIGVLVIDSIIPGDFKDFDLKFHEILASYLAIAIQNQRLYEKHATYQEKIYREDRSLALQIFMKSFFHDVVPPVQEIRSQINVMRLDGKEKWEENLDELDRLADKLFSRYDKLKKDFSEPSFNESVTIGIRELIANSLETVEMTRGLGIPINGNYKDKELNIECYPVFVEMAFRAIIFNAIKYSQGMKTEERYLKIDIKQKIKSNQISISFESSAVEMIPPGKLEEIFKPFVRLAKTEKGQGLGLSLVAECIKNLHNGDIWAENIEERSAVCFNVSLPRTLKIIRE